MQRLRFDRSGPDERADRIVSNELLFREVNERVKDLEQRYGADQQATEFVCECGDSACSQRVGLTREEYESVRSDPVRFVVVPGHELPDVEQVLSANERFIVVAKRAGRPAQLAEEADPRGEDG